MDPFTQRMLDKAAQRSRVLGISNKVETIDCAENNEESFTAAVKSHSVAQRIEKDQVIHHHSKLPSSSRPATNIASSSNKFLQVIEKPQSIESSKMLIGCGSPKKGLRQFAAVDKENMDLGIEINIMTDKNVEVQVQVEEQDSTDDGDEGCQIQKCPAIESNNEPPLAKIRDTSRNRLQRLGALYSDTADLSSPIHRTEEKFHADIAGENDVEGIITEKSKQRYGKLAALATSINQWEDDTSHHHHHQTNLVPPPKPTLLSRNKGNLVEEKTKTTSNTKSVSEVAIKSVAKHTPDVTDSDHAPVIPKLKWDPNVINSLEAQGFQRRESSSVKFAYDYSNNDDKSVQEAEQQNLIGVKSNVSKLVSNFKSTAVGSHHKGKDVDVEKKVNVRPGLVSGRAAAFEKVNADNKVTQPQKDPIELSLKERMQLFEKNKGEALVPKAALGMAPSIQQMRKDNINALASTVSPKSSSHQPCVKVGTESKVRDKVAALIATNTKTISGSRIREELNKQREKDMQILANRFNRQKELTDNQLQHSPDVRNEINNVAATSARHASPPQPPPPPPMPKIETNTLSSKRRSLRDTIEEETKRARKSSSIRDKVKPLYPSLSVLESNDEDEEESGCATTAIISTSNTSDELKEDENYDERNADVCNSSLGREVMQAVHKGEMRQATKHIKEVHYNDEERLNDGADTSLNSSDASVGVDEYLDEALDDRDDEYTEESYDENTSRLSGGHKGTTSSNSFSYRKICGTISEEGADSLNCYTPARASNSVQKPMKSELSVNREETDVVTLVHTVSFYRRQQNSANSTPVRKISREQHIASADYVNEQHFASAMNQQSQEQFSNNEPYDEDDSELDADADDGRLVQEKIKKLLDEVCKQQQVIAQTSQALNLCAATVEFSGSTESVEGERHLLVATHRRQACLDEVQRLRIEKSLRPLGAPREKGRLTVKEITLPLRQDYIRKLSADAISGHHLVCLLKYNEHVLATKTVPTLPGLLAVKFPDVLQLNNVYADFKVTLEIYGMTAQREVLPHEIKYHINVNKKSGIKTPKKKGSDNRLVMPPIQSPAGPNVVRTPALVQYGFAIFSLREIQRITWSLTQVLGVSPLSGVVHMKVNCELSVTVDHKGFITMFEDISGFGAWHRRWCHLNGTVLNYWKYPDDEKRKAPMGSIDLYTCTSPKITAAPRDICARLNTMLLECERPAKDTDQESLIIVPNGRNTIVRYLLSADTKEEREEWCAYFNKALTLLRAWGTPQ